VKPWAAICALFITIAWCSAASSDAPSITTIADVKKSVLPIECIHSSPRLHQVVNGNAGTAFWVNRDGDFVTADHVVESVKALAGTCEPAVLLAQNTQQHQNTSASGRPIYWFDPSGCEQDPSDDLAVCRTIENPFADPTAKGDISPVRFATRPHPDGTDIAFTGFPSGYAWPVTARASIAASSEVNTLATITIDRPTWHGMSGAPVFIAGGGVIGLILGSETADNTGLCIARPGSVIMEFLREHHIAFDVI
jgi:S1-C subfamily serine protease